MLRTWLLGVTLLLLCSLPRHASAGEEDAHRDMAAIERRILAPLGESRGRRLS